MNAIRVETTIEQDGELHLKNIPCRKGDRVEAIVLLLELPPDEADAARRREEAFQQFMKSANEPRFNFTGPIPKRDELYDRKL